MRIGNSKRLSLNDLEWALSEGISLFERSRQGVILEQAWLYNVPSDVLPEDVTAWPSGPRQPATAKMPDEIAIGRVGRVRNSLAGLSGTHRRALELYHGTEGSRWANHVGGRLVALFELTEHGAQLIARTRRNAKGALLELSDAERLGVEIQVDATTGGRNEIVRRLITLAKREAQDLYDAAVVSWEATR